MEHGKWMQKPLMRFHDGVGIRCPKLNAQQQKSFVEITMDNYSILMRMGQMDGRYK